MNALPSRLGLALLAVTALLVAVSPLTGFVVGALVLVAIVVDAARVRREVFVVEVSHPARVGLGDSAALTVRFTSEAARSLRVRFVLDAPPGLAADATDAEQPDDLSGQVRLGAHARVDAPLTLLARRRGRHSLGRVSTRVQGPLGLAWWQRSSGGGGVVEVVPGLREVRTHRLLALTQHLHVAGLRSARRRGDGGQVESLREYAVGDDPRLLDWKATARRGSLVVRSYEAERSQSIVLCIDAGRATSSRSGAADRLDHALSAAVLVGEIARASSDQVGVFAFSRSVDVALPPVRQAPGKLASLFATLEGHPVEPDYPAALRRLSRMVSRRSLIIVFSDVVDDAVSAPLVAELSRLARRHLPLFVALRNADVFAAASSPATDLPSVYRRATAAELVVARATTLARLSAAGVSVVDTAPEGAVAAAVNAYLEIKRRRAL